MRGENDIGSIRAGKIDDGRRQVEAVAIGYMDWQLRSASGSGQLSRVLPIRFKNLGSFPLISLHKRQLPAVAIGVEDVNGIIRAVPMRPDFFDAGADIF